MRSAVLVLGLFAACKFTSPGSAQRDAPIAGDAGPDADAPGDGDIPPEGMTFMDAPLPAAQCFGTATFERICLPAPLPAAQLTFGSPTAIDTDDPAACDTTALGTTVDACVRAGTSIIVDGAVTAHGSRPLVLLATAGSIQINGSGVVDVASHAGVRGAGADPAGCTGTPPMGSGGGFGGTLRGAGGNGGTGSNSGGIADAATTVTRLRGGCSGGTGGTSAGGLGGHGGGAVDLIADASIIVNGIVNASGAGGAGGSGSLGAGGGGGGGSGGVIVFDTQNLTLNGSARVIATGGGGGGGSTAVLAGGPGDDPDPAQIGNAANGGTSAGGGTGGNGATGSNGNGGNSGTGGGGGGGGTGHLKSLATNQTLDGSRSPAVNN